MVQGNDALAEALGQRHLVGNHHHGDAHAVDGLQQLHHLHAQLGVNVAGGLVRNDELRAMYQRAGQSNALLLTARNLIRQPVGLICQAHQAQNIGHPLFDLVLRDVGYAHGEGHIFIHAHGGNQAEILKNHAHAAAQIGHLAFFHDGKIQPIHQHPAAGGLLFPQDQLDKGGLACAGVAQHKHKVALADAQVHMLQRMVAAFVIFGDILEYDHRFQSPPFRPPRFRAAKDRCARVCRFGKGSRIVLSLSFVWQ